MAIDLEVMKLKIEVIMPVNSYFGIGFNANSMFGADMLIV